MRKVMIHQLSRRTEIRERGKRGKTLAVMCPDFMQYLYGGEKVFPAMLSAKSIHPRYEWEINLMQWRWGSERVNISQVSRKMPVKCWPSIAALIRSVAEVPKEAPARIYLISDDDYEEVMELKSKQRKK